MDLLPNRGFWRSKPWNGYWVAKLYSFAARSRVSIEKKKHLPPDHELQALNYRFGWLNWGLAS